ncbi:MAG: hypothetical protein GY795_12985 [Desulfobacterales bacterium]|nr:hypothetical protein [Desulfobacterales bacterium]
MKFWHFFKSAGKKYGPNKGQGRKYTFQRSAENTFSKKSCTAVLKCIFSPFRIKKD